MPSGSRGTRLERPRPNVAKPSKTYAPRRLDLAMMVAEKVVGRALTEGDHRRLADEALDALATPIKTRN